MRRGARQPPGQPLLGEQGRGEGQQSGQGEGRAGQDGLAPAGRAGPWGHSSRRGQHHAAGSTTPNSQTWDQDLGPPCKRKGSCGPASTSISPHGPCAAHMETGIPADLLLHGVLSASLPPPLYHVAGLPVSTALSVTCLSRM